MKKFFLAFVLGIAMCFQGIAQNIPVDSSVKIGTLSNGMKYYIKKNVKPEKKVEFRLAINAGSVLEDDSQRGLAHFMEHMNFNGTKSFPGNKLVDALETAGIKFGQHLNAYTSFDETVYMLPVPLDKPGNLDLGFKVMEDWAFNALLTDEEINKERGVVLEELRLGLGPDKRMMDKWLPKMLYKSQYAERLPIGKKEVLENFKPDVLRKFHKDWYRPDLMAIIVVGDIDVNEIEKKIKNNFSKYKNPAKPVQRKEFNLPNHKETLVAVETDPDASFSQVNFVIKDAENYKPDVTVADYNKSIVDNLAATMINNRLDELVNSNNPPFTYGYVYHGGTYARTKEAFQGFAMTKEGGQMDALKVLLEETERAKKFGFTQGELDRAKAQVLSRLEKSYNDRDKTESSRLVGEYVRNFLEQEAIPGITWEYEQTKKVMPSITLAQTNDVIKGYVKDDSRVVVITGPEKADLVQPTSKQVENIFAQVAKEDLKPYVERATIKNLVKPFKSNGKIAKTDSDSKLGTTTWTLSNGAKVTFKKTDFKDDEIVFMARSLGGNSLLSDQDYIKTQFAYGALDEAGLNGHDKVDLTNYLAGKQVSVNPYVGSTSEGLNGRSTVKDLPTTMELIYAYFTGLNYDADAFNAYKEKQNAIYKNLTSNPQFYFSSEFSKWMYQNNPRFTSIVPMEEDWAKTDYKKAYDFYKEKFANAGNFHFYFVGNIDEAPFKENVLQYIASLPSTGKTETYKDSGYRPISGEHKKVIKKGKDPKSMVIISYSGEAPYNEKEDLALSALGEVATIKVIEKLREDESGIYGGGANGGMSKVPYGSYSFGIQFPCGPENVDKLTKAALAEVQKFIDKGPEQKDLDKFKEGEYNDNDTNLKSNSYWMRNIASYDYQGGDKYEILNYESKVKALTVKDLQNVAKKYLTKGKITAILMPEDGWEKAAEEAKKAEAAAAASAAPLSSVKDLSIQQVLGNYVAALGGKAKLEAVKTIKMDNSMKVMGMEMTGSEKKMAPNKFRKVQSVMGQESVTVFDGTKGMVMQGGQKVMDLTPEQIEALKDAKLFDALTMEASDYTKVTKATEGGKNYYILEDEDGGKNYFDVTTGLLAKGASEMGEMEILEWKDVDGIKFPVKMSASAQGQKIEISNSNIELNKGVTEADFK